MTKVDNKAVNILIVEDDRAIRIAFQHLLELQGYTVHVAENGQAALDFLRSHSKVVNLILLDLMMPVKDGFQFREEQLQDPKILHIPVVIMSADNHVEEKQRITNAKAYLRKPFEIDRVLEAIENSLVA